MRKVLFLGDVVGRPGRRILKEKLAALRQRLGCDLAIANGENAAGGAGITGKIALELHRTGLDALTLGDHVWDQRNFDDEIDGLTFVCRPANLPASNPGRARLLLSKDGFRLAIFTVLGRSFMNPKVDCPFATADRFVEELREKADAVIVEIHAETTAEKVALGWHLDGKVAAVLGTHTHVPTADARILPAGTAYLTDLGMTGPRRSVIGRQIEACVGRFRDGMPRKCPVAEEDVRIQGAFLEIEPSTGLSLSITQVDEAEV